MAGIQPPEIVLPSKTEPPAILEAPGIICGVCARQFSKYSCPRCNLRYCCVACYKACTRTRALLPTRR